MTRLNLFRNPLQRWFNKGGRETVPVKALGEHDRRRMLRHFLSLERPDRILRFGSFMSDEQVTKYVNGIDFNRDMVFGVYNRVFRLAAVGHLAFAPRQPASEGVTEKDRVAEFGVSVLKSARGLGIGSKLFEPFVTSKADGMGLGLAISRSLVRVAGGDLRSLGRADERDLERRRRDRLRHQHPGHPRRRQQPQRPCCDLPQQRRAVFQQQLPENQIGTQLHRS